MWLKFLRGSSFGSTTHEGVVYCLQSTLANHVFIFSTAILKSIIQPRWNKNFLLTIAIFTFQVLNVVNDSVVTCKSLNQLVCWKNPFRWCYAWRTSGLWDCLLMAQQTWESVHHKDRIPPLKVFQDPKYSRVFWCWTSNHSLNNLMASEPYLLRADSVAPQAFPTASMTNVAHHPVLQSRPQSKFTSAISWNNHSSFPQIKQITWWYQ